MQILVPDKGGDAVCCVGDYSHVCLGLQMWLVADIWQNYSSRSIFAVKHCVNNVLLRVHVHHMFIIVITINPTMQRRSTI